MPKRKYVFKEDYDKLCKKLKEIEKEVSKKRRHRVRVLSSSSSSDEEEFHARRSQRDDRLSKHSRARDTSPRGSCATQSSGNRRQRASRRAAAESPPPAAAASTRSATLATPAAAASAAAAAAACSPYSSDVDAAAVAVDSCPPPAPGPAPVAPLGNEAPTPSSNETTVTSHLPDEVALEVLDTAPELDADILEILGVDPTRTETYGKLIQKDVAVRFEHTATVGLSKEERKDLMTKYLIPENCKMIGAPALNPEVKAALSDAVIKRDVVIESKQKLMASAISSLGDAISLVITAKEKNTDLVRLLMDTGKTLCDCQHHESNIRRNFVSFAVKKDMKESLQSTKIDSYLFGQNLSETLKAAKAINKQGSELKLPITSKPTASKSNLPSTSKNWRGQGRAQPARNQPAATPKPASTKAPPSREPRAAYSRRSQPRGGHSRR